MSSFTLRWGTLWAIVTCKANWTKVRGDGKIISQ